MGRETQHQRQSPFTRYAQHPLARHANSIRKTVADSIAYRRVPKTYLSVQDRELLSAHTKRPARNGHYSKTFNGNSVFDDGMCLPRCAHTCTPSIRKSTSEKIISNHYAITCDEDGAPLMMIVALEFWSVDFKSLWATLLIKKVSGFR